jgi:processive 1,2-diacylglycerol beta-glucosyltransferase
MASTASRPLRILLLTLSFGAGHAQAAVAVAEAIRRRDPGADVRVIDAFAQTRWLFRVGYVWPYWLMLRYWPGLWRRLFAARLRDRTRRTAPAWAFRFGCPAVFDAIRSMKPDAIVATEVAACELAAIARLDGDTDAAIVNVITDHHAEPAWVTPLAARYAVPDVAVAAQLCGWGASPDRIVITGLPTAAAFGQDVDVAAVRTRYGAAPDRPIVLLMGGGMGPTRMDLFARDLLASGEAMHVMAIAGHDNRAHRRLSRLRATTRTSLTVLGWTDDVPALMRSAAVLVTKPGGVTIAEAARCGLPMVLFEGIPGPEDHNSGAAVADGRAVVARERLAAVTAVLTLLRAPDTYAAMAANAWRCARPAAADAIASLASAVACDRRKTPPGSLIMTIRNGAGHTRCADAIAQAMRRRSPGVPVSVVDVADYMTIAGRLTHVTVFLWLVRHMPWLWDRIDRFQKRQPRTSPDWYYRRTCAPLFALARALRPTHLVATEVGCCEIATLMKRDLGIAGSLVAVNGEYDADRAWVQPEVSLYSVPDARVRDELVAHGADPQRVHVWGVPLDDTFLAPPRRSAARATVCGRLDLQTDRPMVLVAGGSEGLGRVDAILHSLLTLCFVKDMQIIVLAGRSSRLRRRCDALVRADAHRVRVLGWTDDVCELMDAADLLVSKLGHTFDEAVARTLPVVALEPPPGSERVQYRLLDEWGVGRPVRSLRDMAETVDGLLTDAGALHAMRVAASRRPRMPAAHSIAQALAIDPVTTALERFA